MTKNMFAVLYSLLLPFLSHVTRQYIACEGMSATDAFAFQLIYGGALLLHSQWVECNSRPIEKAILFLWGTTSIATVTAHAYSRSTFRWVWLTHAVPSAALWPVAFREINREPRSHSFLTLWSLQATAGDILGCVASGVDLTLRVVIAVVCGLCLAWAIACCPVEQIVDASVPLLSPTSERTRLTRLLLLVIASGSLKVVSYSASNWMPTLHLHYYWYAAGTAVGATLASMVLRVADLRASSICGSIAVTMLSAAAFYRALFPVVMAFGVALSFTSTLISVCCCALFAGGRFGWTTAIADGTATVLSAIAQLFVTRYFWMSQLACSCALTASVSLLLLESAYSSPSCAVTTSSR